MPEVKNETEENPKFKIEAKNFERSWDDESRRKVERPKDVSVTDWLALVEQLRKTPMDALNTLQASLRVRTYSKKELRQRSRLDRFIPTDFGKENLKYVWEDGPPYPVVLTNIVEHQVKERKHEYSCSYTIASQSDPDGEKFGIKSTLKWDDVQVEIGQKEEQDGRVSDAGSSLTESAQTGRFTRSDNGHSGDVAVSGSHLQSTLVTTQTSQQ